MGGSLGRRDDREAKIERHGGSEGKRHRTAVKQKRQSYRVAEESGVGGEGNIHTPHFLSNEPGISWLN